MKFTSRMNKLIKFSFFFLIIAFIITLIIYNNTNNKVIIEKLKDLVNTLSNNKINYIIIHFNILTILFISSLFLLDFLTLPIYLLFELISIFYNIILFSMIYYFKGFIYGLIYVIFTKLIFIISTILIAKYLHIIVKKIYNYLKNKNDYNMINLKNNITKIIILLIMISIYDFFLYLFGNNILSNIAKLIILK